MKGPTIGKFYAIQFDGCCGTHIGFMAKLIDVTPLQVEGDQQYDGECSYKKQWMFHFDNGVVSTCPDQFTEITKWYHWDCDREFKDDTRINASLPFSVLCSECKCDAKPLTERELKTLGMPVKIPQDECIECGDDPAQTISAQYLETPHGQHPLMRVEGGIHVGDS
jgi:hypothetical protein